jgi:Flp pilus assembly secretin CpaC
VAKLALNRPLASLGLVGILESRSALRQRIERLLDFRAPKTAGLTFASLLAIGAFSAVALPMGEGPSPAEKQSAPNPAATKPQPQLALTFKMTHLESEGILKKQLLEAGVKIPPTIVHDFNNGILFARGTREQLVLVNQTIWRLNGYSPQEIATATNLPDYAIKIPVDEPATPPLFSRTFKLNIDVVSANLLKQTDGQSNAPDSTAVSAAFRELFIRLGLNLESPPGKSIFYNEKLGKLFVKTTASDLDVIELAVMALLQPSTQNTGGHSPPVEATNVVGVTGVLADPNFRAKIHALEQRSGVTSLKEPEMTRRIGHSINQAPASISGAIPASSRPAATTNPAPQLHIKARFVEVPESFLSGAAKNSFPAGMTNGTGILTATAAKKLIKEFESQKDTEWLAEPEVTTTSGRQTQMRTTEVITIITNMMFEENQTNSWIQPATNALETGPIFDVMPTVLADGDTLDLRMTASLKKFFGYPDFPANAKLQTATNSAGEVITLPPVWPAVESWRKSAHVVLWDGQTAVMTLNQPEQVRFAEPDAKREEVVAEQIRAAKKKNHMDGKELIVFVTATIVDPAGNRVHADDDLPSAKTGIPPQPPTK